MSSTDELLAEISENTRRTLHYSRARFLATWLVVALLAMLTGVAIILANNAAETNLKQTDDIARVANHTAKTASAQSDQTVAYLRGETGIPGVPGANGKNGSPGQPSSEPGPKGDTGATGAVGPIGATGPSGASGGAGAVGATGLPGSVGEPGVPGTDGASGPQGSKGDKGDAGARGDPGPAGPAGAVGPAGPAGAAAPPLAPQTITATSALDTFTVKQVTATCPASTTVLSGGFRWVPTTPLINEVASYPQGNGWFVEASANGLAPTIAWNLTVIAVCA